MPKTNAVRKSKKEPDKTAAIQVLPPSERPWLLNQDEVAIIKNSVAKGASDEELKFLLTVARRYRLDPFKKQIWFIRRYDSKADNGQGGKGGYVWTPQVGIDGLLFAAGRDHKQDLGSISLPQFGPMIAIGNTKAPEWARVKVWKKGESEPTEAEAWWSEYAPEDLSKAPFWRKMPRRMLAKCATALAIRQAYPDLGGLYIPEETERMQDDVTPNGRRIIDTTNQQISTKEVTSEDLEKYESITLTPWKEGRVAISGECGLKVIKMEFAPETISELGIVHNAKEKVTHMPVANVFKFIDRAKLCKVEAHYEEPISSSAEVGESDGNAVPQREAPLPSQETLIE